MTHAIDADSPNLTDEEKAKVAEFEASLPQAVKTNIAGLKMHAAIERILGFCAPSHERLEQLQTRLIARTFAARDRSLIIPGDIHPLLDPKTGRPVALVASLDELVELRLWVSMIPPAENQAAVERGRAMGAISRWLCGLCAFGRRVGSVVGRFVYVWSTWDPDPEEESDDELG